MCKRFILKTLDIGHRNLDTDLRNCGEAGTFTAEDKHGKRTTANKTSQVAKALVKRHIESFSRIESRYTRRDGCTLYLDQSLSISKLYTL